MSSPESDLAYYNDLDPHACEWGRNLIEAGLVSPGVVDGRSIAEIQSNDVSKYVRCHFFSGIFGWDLALQLAGWPVDRPVWTGSCPCQPYSAAGKGLGNDDPRNLWPEFFRLIRECRPDTVFSEQTESAIKHGWLDGISADLEGEGYAVGSVVLGAHCVGSPHIRQRLYWVANAKLQRAKPGISRVEGRPGIGRDRPAIDGTTSGLVNATGNGRRQSDPFARRGDQGIRAEGDRCRSLDDCNAGRLGDSIRPRSEPRHGAWGDFDLIPCRDGKSRRVESGSFPLVARLSEAMVRSSDPGLEIDPQNSAEGRSMRLKGYGNSIVPQVAAEFVIAFLEAERNQVDVSDG